MEVPRVSLPSTAEGRGAFTEDEVMRGRYPAGSEYVEKVEGSQLAKERGRVLLELQAGRLRLLEACEQLGVRETRLHQLRHAAMQGWVQNLEPGVPGRPGLSLTPKAERIRELEQLLAEKELALQQALVREEVALILPRRGEVEAVKKGQRPSVKLGKRKPR
jgi:hypothetical protein